MSSEKRSKVRKYRGSKTHGGGSMKKRRGAGHRGGRGNAGSGKRGDARKPSFWKSDSFGRGPRGFSSVGQKEIETMSLSELSVDLGLLVEAGHAVKGKSGYEVNLEAAGVDKLLGNGRISETVIVTVPQASAGAIEKVSAAGGSVTVTAVKKEKTKKASDKKKDESEDESE